jgi:4,5:9,10-diseco-3-hydroxy-5,9,17-trioxoandrosta-1(10),2-diene-4-oate hydrolase
MRLPTDRYIDIATGGDSATGSATGTLRLRYWFEGDHGPPLVLIHGIGGSVDVWRKQFEHLALTHCVLALDLPGCGRSAIPPQYPSDTLGMLAGAVRAVMQAVGIEQATVIGSSLGGAVAVEFAMRWPALVSALVLIGPAGMTHKVAWTLRLMTIRGVGELMTLPDRTRTGHAIRGCVANPAVVEEEDIDRAFALATLPGAQDAFLRLLRTYANVRGLDRNELHRLQAGMRTIHAPTLVIWGEQDQILPVAGAYAALHSLPNAGLIVRKGSGHLVFIDEPAWFDELVTAFVRSPAHILACVRREAPVPDAAEPQQAQAAKQALIPAPAPVSRYLTPRTLAVTAAGLLLVAGVQFFRQQNGQPPA